VNPAFERLTGLKRTDLIGKQVREVLPGIESYWIENYGKVVLTGEPLHMENFTNNLKRWYSVFAYRPAPDRFAVVFSDITDRKKAEEALSESEQRFRTMADAIPQLAWIAKADGWIYWYNRRWYEYTGTTPQQMEGWGWQSVHDPQVLTNVLKQWKEAIKTGEPFDMVFPLRGSDGCFRPFLTRIQPLKDAQGHVLQWFGTNTDIEELKRAEEELQHRTAELEIVNKDLESFIYSVSHDLRSPIRTMAGFAKIMIEDYADKVDNQGKDYLSRIQTGSERMARLIEDLLKLSRVTRQDMDRIETDLSGKAAAVIAELREADSDRIVEVSIQPGLKASTDPRLIEVALSNILGNAWKFTSKTKNARIEFGATQKDGTTVYFVKDNGVGFDQMYTEKMFLPFHRLHSEKDFEGTGIGLAIVERIIHRHAGKVWAEGETRKGATIYFTLG